MLQSRAMIEVFILNWCEGTNIEVGKVHNWNGPSWNGIEFELYEQFNNHKNFESDIGNLIEYLEEILDANIFIDEPNFDFLQNSDNKEKCRCFLKIGVNC